MRLQLFRPLKKWNVTNKFAQNDVCSFPDRTGIFSTDGTCPPGKVLFYPLINLPGGHNGLDLEAPMWTPIYASHSGYIQSLETRESMGLTVYLVSNEEFEFSGQVSYAKTVYIHMSAYNVKEGDKIRVGDFLGWSGNTGLSGGPHLHYGLTPCDKDGKKLYPDNGFGGYVDPQPYMSEQFALDALNGYERIKQYLALFSEEVANWLRGNYERSSN